MKKKIFVIAVFLIIIECLSLPAFANPYPFNTEPWTRIVEADLDFGTGTYADLAFNVYVVRSTGTYIWFSVVNGINGQYDSNSRYIRDLVDGVNVATHLSSAGSGAQGAHSFEDYAGVLTTGWHIFTIRIDGGYEGYDWYLDFLSLCGGNYVYEVSANAYESQNIITPLSFNGHSVNTQMSTDGQFPDQFIIDKSLQPGSIENYNILGEVTNVPTGYFCDSFIIICWDWQTVTATSTTISFSTRIIDNPTIAQGTSWINLNTISAVTSSGTDVQEWTVSNSFTYQGISIGYSTKSTVSSADLPSTTITNSCPIGGCYDNWRSLGSITKSWPSGSQTDVISAKAAFAFDVGNAYNWEMHNIQFEVSITTNWHSWSKTSSSWTPLYTGSTTYTYILGDGYGLAGSNSDRWITIIPGCITYPTTCS